MLTVDVENGQFIQNASLQMELEFQNIAYSGKGCAATQARQCNHDTFSTICRYTAVIQNEICNSSVVDNKMEIAGLKWRELLQNLLYYFEHFSVWHHRRRFSVYNIEICF